MNAAQRLNQLSVIKRREEAAARRAKVKALKDKGYTAQQIAEELGIKVRLVYQDNAILKKEAATEETEKNIG